METILHVSVWNNRFSYVLLVSTKFMIILESDLSTASLFEDAYA
jgi:hypothetical protein